MPQANGRVTSMYIVFYTVYVQVLVLVLVCMFATPIDIPLARTVKVDSWQMKMRF